MRKLLFLSIVVMIIIGLLVGCAPTTAPSPKPAPTPAPSSPSTAGPLKGGALKVAFVRPPVNFGYPAAVTGPDQNFARLFFERLIRLDDKCTYKPELATSWDVAQDGKSIIFKLRQGVKFHDGTDFNADAVKFNYDPLLPPKSNTIVGASSIDKIDDYTIKFNLPSYNNLIMYGLAADMRLGIASPTAIQKNGADGSRVNPVGTGPFKLKGFERNISVTGMRNPDYWDKNLPYLDEFTFTTISDPMTSQASFKSGEFNVMFDARIPIADQLKKEGYQLFNSPATIQCYCFDTDHPDSVFANQKVREAIEYAVDKEAIMNGPMLGYYKSAYQTVLTDSPGYNPACPPRKYDPVKAKQLLTEAGYPNGFSFKYLINETEAQEPPTAVQNYLSKIGVSMEIVKLAPAAFETTVRVGRNLEKNTAAHMVLDYRADNLFMLNNYLRSNTQYYQNTIKPAGLDDLLDQAMAAKDDQTKNKLIQQISKAIYDNASYIPMQVQPRIVIVDKKAQDVGFCLCGDCQNGYWGYASWLKK